MKNGQKSAKRIPNPALHNLNIINIWHIAGRRLPESTKICI